MKWICIPVILLCAYCAGKGLYIKLNERQRLLCGICGFIRAASSEIRVRLTPLDRLPEEAARSDDSPEFLQVCAQRLRDGDGFHDAWLYSVRESPDMQLLRDSERSELERLGLSLGYYDAEGELALLLQAFEYFSDVRSDSADELKKKSGMYMTCSMLTGLAIVLVLL